MVEEYELIKKYPGLPSDWKIGMIVGRGNYFERGFAPCSSAYIQTWITQTDVIGQTEFWQKVIEIPEYVKCVRDCDIRKTTIKFKENIIYKNVTINSIDSDVRKNCFGDRFNSNECLSSINKYFIPSTKEEFDLQENTEEYNIFVVNANIDCPLNTVITVNGERVYSKKDIFKLIFPICERYCGSTSKDSLYGKIYETLNKKENI